MQARGFMNWTRSVAMWIVWNIPIGIFAPVLMDFALNSKAVLKDSGALSGKSKK